MSTANADFLARTVLRTEAAAILSLVDSLDDDFIRAVDSLCECRGRVAVTGMGKSGIDPPEHPSDALEHRNCLRSFFTGLGDPWRPRNAARRRRRAHRLAQRRDRRSDQTAQVDPPHRRAADCNHRLFGARRWRGRPTCRSIAASTAKRARSTWRRRRAPLRHLRSATRWQCRCSSARDSARRISPRFTPAGGSADG